MKRLKISTQKGLVHRASLTPVAAFSTNLHAEITTDASLMEMAPPDVGAPLDSTP
jgi:hypothetical protein